MAKKKKTSQDKGRIFVKGIAIILSALMILSVATTLIYCLL